MLLSQIENICSTWVGREEILKAIDKDTKYGNRFRLHPPSSNYEGHRGYRTPKFRSFSLFIVHPDFKEIMDKIFTCRKGDDNYYENIWVRKDLEDKEIHLIVREFHSVLKQDSDWTNEMWEGDKEYSGIKATLYYILRCSYDEWIVS